MGNGTETNQLKCTHQRLLKYTLRILEQNTATCNFGKLLLCAPYLLQNPEQNISPSLHSTPTTSTVAALVQTHIFLIGLLYQIPYQSSCLQSYPHLPPVFTLMPETSFYHANVIVIPVPLHSYSQFSIDQPPYNLQNKLKSFSLQSRPFVFWSLPTCSSCINLHSSFVSFLSVTSLQLPVKIRSRVYSQQPALLLWPLSAPLTPSDKWTSPGRAHKGPWTQIRSQLYPATVQINNELISLTFHYTQI